MRRTLLAAALLARPTSSIPPDATAALAGVLVNANTIAKAGFTARYGRTKK